MPKHDKVHSKQYELHRNIPAIPLTKSEQPLSRPLRNTRTANSTIPPEKRRRLSVKKVLFILLMIPLSILLTIGIWDMVNLSRASNKLFGTGNLFSFISAYPPDNNDGKTNILLVGYSADDPGHAGAALTDSIMILSLDKQNKKGYTLSIPRDLYIRIPEYGNAKINEAYQAGERSDFNVTGYPPGGMGLLEAVITENLGIEIHYYALFNYASVREVVDALEGVDVIIDSPDPRGIYDPNFRPHEGGPLQLTNGTQLIDGQTALRLTRARGATAGSYGFPLSDFNRAKNQQAVLAAIKRELDWTLLLKPHKNGKIMDSAADNIETDIEASEALGLYNLFTSIPNTDLKPLTLNDLGGINLLRNYTAPNGQSTLIPAKGVNNFSQLKTALEQLGF